MCARLVHPSIVFPPSLMSVNYELLHIETDDPLALALGPHSVKWSLQQPIWLASGGAKLFLTMDVELLKTVNTTGPEGIKLHSEVTDRWLSH